MEQQCYAENISLGRPVITQYKSVTELQKMKHNYTLNWLYYMTITVDRKDIAKCLHFTEYFEFDQIQYVLSSVRPVGRSEGIYFLYLDLPFLFCYL